MHANPGIVKTNIAKNSPSRLRYFEPIINVLLWPIAVSEEECGEYLLSGLLDAKAGAERRSEKGDDLGKSPYTTQELRNALWKHTETLIESILSKARAVASRS